MVVGHSAFHGPPFTSLRGHVFCDGKTWAGAEEETHHLCHTRIYCVSKHAGQDVLIIGSRPDVKNAIQQCLQPLRSSVNHWKKSSVALTPPPS